MQLHERCHITTHLVLAAHALRRHGRLGAAFALDARHVEGMHPARGTKAHRKFAPFGERERLERPPHAGLQQSHAAPMDQGAPYTLGSDLRIN